MTRPERASWGRRRGVPGAIVDNTTVLLTALRLLGRHWPALLTLFLAGILVRELVMRVAVRASLVNGVLGTLVLLLAPMAMLAALVLMLWVVRPSLPWLSTRPESRPPSVLVHLGSVLVPFIAIYQLDGALVADLRDYQQRVLQDTSDREIVDIAERLESGSSAGGAPVDIQERLPYDLTVTLVAVVAAAVVARALLSRLDQTRHRRWLGLPGAYLELIWVTLVTVVAFKAVREWAVDWADDRRAVQVAQNLWGTILTRFGGDGPALFDWFAAQLGRVDVVIVTPVVWLTVGAVVIAHQATDRLAAARQPTRSRFYRQAERRWLAAPYAFRWLVLKITADLRGRFTPLAQSIRLLTRAGIIPMLIFCLAFVAVDTAASWLWELQRLLIGPRDVAGVWVPLSWPLGEINRAIVHVLLICLVAAAIDRALAATQPVSGTPAPPETPAGRAHPPEETSPPTPSAPPTGTVRATASVRANRSVRATAPAPAPLYSVDQPTSSRA